MACLIAVLKQQQTKTDGSFLKFQVIEPFKHHFQMSVFYPNYLKHFSLKDWTGNSKMTKNLREKKILKTGWLFIHMLKFQFLSFSSFEQNNKIWNKSTLLRHNN